jgi:hypothetical protein
MHFLTLLILLFGFALVVCLSLIKATLDLSQTSVHESPAFIGPLNSRPRVDVPPAIVAEPFESSPRYLGDEQ